MKRVNEMILVQAIEIGGSLRLAVDDRSGDGGVCRECRLLTDMWLAVLLKHFIHSVYHRKGFGLPTRIRWPRSTF